MTRIGLPVPPGFTITAEACNEYIAAGEQFPGAVGSYCAGYENPGRKKPAKCSAAGKPLLVSVRSGAAVSMPGMMDTILNLGLNDQTVQGLAALTGDMRFAYDCYRRFIQMFSNVVLNVEHHLFDNIVERYKRKLSLIFDYEIPAAELQSIIDDYKTLVKTEKGLISPRM